MFRVGCGADAADPADPAAGEEDDAPDRLPRVAARDEGDEPTASGTALVRVRLASVGVASAAVPSVAGSASARRARRGVPSAVMSMPPRRAPGRAGPGPRCDGAGGGRIGTPPA